MCSIVSGNRSTYDGNTSIVLCFFKLESSIDSLEQALSKRELPMGRPLISFRRLEKDWAGGAEFKV